MRTECLYNEELIHIADYFTVKDGKQIAIEGEIEKLRTYGKKGHLICSCGCGGKVTLVAGKKMLRRQHFRLKEKNAMCKSYEESPKTINAKVVLKCWLDDIFDLQSQEILFNVPIGKVSDIDRRYEYTYLIESKKIGICYERKESNLNDEKIKLLSVREGITNLCITDIENDGCCGQYPEFGIKAQRVQEYCALLAVGEKTPYEEATLKIIRYEKTHGGIWVQLDVCEAKLSQYSFDENNKLCLNGSKVYELTMSRRNEYIASQEEQKRMDKEAVEAKRRAEEELKAYKEQREDIYRETKPEKRLSYKKEPTKEDIFKQNPMISELVEYISKLDTLGGTFTYVSKKDGRKESKYEKIKIKDVNLNPNRMRIEINSNNDKRYIIYLKMDKSDVNTQYTWDGYLVFSFFGGIESDILFEFRQMLECNSEIYEKKYICTLDYSCPHKSDALDICTYTSADNKCSYRDCIKKFKKMEEKKLRLCI